MKVALNEKRKKLRGFSFFINIANFEAFWGVKKLSANLSFLKCDGTVGQTIWFNGSILMLKIFIT